MLISGKKTENSQQTNSNLPNSEVIPTVDSSVKVSLDPGKQKGYINLNIKGIPSGTDTIEYEMSYNTAEQGLQGIVPDEPVSVKGKDTFTKEFFLGTQSSGAITYHKVVGPIHITLKFNGSYGAKSFEKEFQL
jgi:hypothetical protein